MTKLIVPHQQGPSAYVGINPGPMAVYLHAQGFFEAADRVLGAGCHDNVIYAALHLIRHGVELCLKDILQSAALVQGSPLPKAGHELGKLWADARPLVESMVDGIDEDGTPLVTGATLQLVDDCIEELHGYDPRGDAFRYPTARNGRPHLGDLVTIDWVNLHSVAANLHRYLLGWAYDLFERAAETTSLRV